MSNNTSHNGKQAQSNKTLKVALGNINSVSLSSPENKYTKQIMKVWSSSSED